MLTVTSFSLTFLSFLMIICDIEIFGMLTVTFHSQYGDHISAVDKGAEERNRIVIGYLTKFY